MGYTVKVPGSCGELAQGYLDNSNFLISCPIDIYSEVTVTSFHNKRSIEIDSKKRKTKEAILKLLDYYNIKDIGLRVEVKTKLPEAKGMSSSTADLSAALLAVIRELKLNLDLSLVKNILLQIEPSDATFLKGINVFDHLEGKTMKCLGTIEPIPLLVFDYGGQVDTINFNARQDLLSLNKAKNKEIKEAYNLIKEGIQSSNKKLIGKGATISSLANQIILEKKDLEDLIKFLAKTDGFLGINIAHSGTVIGIMVSGPKHFNEIIDIIRKKYPKLELLFKTKIINGGFKIRKDEG